MNAKNLAEHPEMIAAPKNFQYEQTRQRQYCYSHFANTETK